MIYLIGEMNPYGEDPRYALYDEPLSASGHNLRTKILGLDRSTYLADGIFSRHNACQHGHWNRPEACAMIERLVDESKNGDLLVMLGRRVSESHPWRLRPFAHQTFKSRGSTMLSLPHPSGLCREWNDPGAIVRARSILASLAPSVPWGELR